MYSVEMLSAPSPLTAAYVADQLDATTKNGSMYHVVVYEVSSNNYEGTAFTEDEMALTPAFDYLTPQVWAQAIKDEGTYAVVRYFQISFVRAVDEADEIVLS